MPVVVFLTAFVTLALEVFYTRLFSAMFWKDTAFAILSLAMLGLGASGVMVYVRPKWFRAERAAAQVAWWAVAFGPAIVVSYVAILMLARTTDNMLAPVWGFGPLIAVTLVPFFVGGTILSIVFTHYAEQISRLYWFDLVGASLGAVVIVPLLVVLNGPAVVPVLALAATLGGVWFARGQSLTPAFKAGIGAAVLVAAVLAGHVGAGWLRVTHSEGKPEIAVTMEQWDPVARITVHQPTPHDTWFHIDSRVASAVLEYDGNPESVGFLRRNVLQLAYHVRRYPKVVIIGPGGGSDVLSALVFGNDDVTAVEVNRSMVSLVKNELADFSGNLYGRPEVNVAIADGRAYVARMDRKVDLIQATFIDTVAASAAGAHTMSEDYLYTTDAIHDFFDHLNDGGVLSLSRWGGVAWGFTETHRVVSVMMKAMLERGIERPEDHIIASRGPSPAELTLGRGYQNPHGGMENMTTVLAKPTPFTAQEVERVATVVRESKFQPLWLASKGGDPTFQQLFESRASPEYYEDYERATGLDISPTTDDRPFFFAMIPPLRELVRAHDPAWDDYSYYWALSVGLSVLYQLLASTAVLVLLLIVVPLLWRLRDLKGVRRPVSTLGYFVCLGLAFIGIEISLMQRLALFLEHPVYSLVVVLAAILLFSGLGSRSTDRISEAFALEGAKRAAVLVGVLSVYGIALPFVVKPLIGLPLPVKMLVGVVVVLPPAYLMGMMFPLGVRAVSRRAAELVPWMWGLNSSFSVLGAIASLFIAMSFGHTVTWYTFTAVYALGALALFRIAGSEAAEA